MKDFWNMPLWYKVLALPFCLIITWILVHIVLRLFGYI